MSCSCCLACVAGLLILLYALYAVLKNYGFLPKKSVKNLHIFITGAGSGIGRLMALRFASLGAKVTIADINMSGAGKVAAEITAAGGKAKAVECNVMLSSAVKDAARYAQDLHGPVDILINNAGIVSGKKILEVSEAMIEKTVAINLTSHAYTVKEFLPEMIKNQKGHIVTIASAAGTVGACGLADYCASKFGAFGFNESLRMEIKKMNYKVKTTCICPFYINTGMFDGVKSKYPWLVPILEEKWAANRIVNAVLQEEEVVLMPFICNLTVLARAVLPVSWFDKLAFVMGVNSSMDEFKGRMGEEKKKD